MTKLVAAVSATTLMLASWGCSSPASKVTAPAKPVGKVIEIKVPLGLPPVPVPADNPPTEEATDLGAKLYFDQSLSVDGTVSCATCHNPTMGFTDHSAVSTGVGGKKGNRNAPTVINAAYYPLQFWDGRAPSLEAQAAGPIANPVEMAHSLEGAERRVAAQEQYRQDFEKVFGPGPVTMDKITRAIATFERRIIAGNSSFDRYFFGGEKHALNAAQIRGLEIFRDAKRGNCVTCHTIEEKSALFMDGKFHNLGVGVDTSGELKDLGRYDQTKQEADKGAFKTPSLRNVAQTGPYMHDGSLKTLKEVVDFYVGGGNSNPNRDKEIKSLDHLSKRDRQDLVAFLESLTGTVAGRND